LLKRVYEADFNEPETIHTFTINKSVTDDGKQKNTQVGIEGTIRGLIPGGLIQQSGILAFPNTGSILVAASPTTNRYDHAKDGYDLIGTNKKLNDDFLEYLGVTTGYLGIPDGCIPSGTIPKPLAHNVTHNYIDGSITYNSSFDSINAARNQAPYQNLNISVEDKTPIIAEFIVPGRSGGPVIQNLNCDKPKRITISMDGFIPPTGCCESPADLVEKACVQLIYLSGVPDITIPMAKLTQNNANYGTDGSFSITKSFIIYDQVE
jgi:hypothetical protein